MNNCIVEDIQRDLAPFVQSDHLSPFNYERYLLVDKAKHLDAFIAGKPCPPFEVEIQISSKCNLQCAWCIGDEVQQRKQVLRLQDNITEDNVDNIVSGIIEYTVGDLTIDTVKFSGFIGEPLLKKSATLRAMQRLVGSGRRVGLFTNGLLMDETTWPTLTNIDYVHVSLDAGPSTFFWLKQGRDQPYTTGLFQKVLDNIAGLHDARSKSSRGSKVRINVGYVVVPGNHDEIKEATRRVKEAGADSMRFKCDIGGKYDLKERPEAMDSAYEQIEDLEKKFHKSRRFAVHVIHSKNDVKKKSYDNWNCEDGCHFQQFLGTIGSDGNLYLCDHNTMPGAIPFGNVINGSFREVWESQRKKYLADGVQYTCQCPVCPPFGNRANLFLRAVRGNVEEYGIEAVAEAIERLRAQLSG